MNIYNDIVQLVSVYALEQFFENPISIFGCRSLVTKHVNGIKQRAWVEYKYTVIAVEFSSSSIIVKVQIEDGIIHSICVDLDSIRQTLGDTLNKRNVSKSLLLKRPK